jgi:hypothetical protein
VTKEIIAMHNTHASRHLTHAGYEVISLQNANIGFIDPNVSKPAAPMSYQFNQTEDPNITGKSDERIIQAELGPLRNQEHNSLEFHLWNSEDDISP